jgi:hypothetical protein
MIRSLKSFENYRLLASDGEVGSVREFYFDDYNWIVRYLAVDVEGGSLLFSPLAFSPSASGETEFVVAYDLEQVLNSPRFDLDQPVTRVFETELHNYYQWPFYWMAPGLASYPLVELAAEMRANENPELAEDQDRQHLQSTRMVLGDRIQARDGEIGHVEDFLIDDTNWNIQYIIVDTGNWLPGRKVLVSPQWIKSVDWVEGEVSIDLNRATIEKSPEYNPDVPLEDGFDRRMQDYYNQE